MHLYSFCFAQTGCTGLVGYGPVSAKNDFCQCVNNRNVSLCKKMMKSVTIVVCCYVRIRFIILIILNNIYFILCEYMYA